MDIPTAIQKLEYEWDDELGKGFFSRLRYDSFDDEGFQRVKDILKTVEIPSGTTIDRRFTELTWFIPVFLDWQREAWVQDGKDSEVLDRAIKQISEALTTILGLP